MDALLIYHLVKEFSSPREGSWRGLNQPLWVRATGRPPRA